MAADARGAAPRDGSEGEPGKAALLKRGFLLSYFSPIHHRWSRWAVVGLMLLFFGSRQRRARRVSGG